MNKEITCQMLEDNGLKFNPLSNEWEFRDRDTGTEIGLELMEGDTWFLEINREFVGNIRLAEIRYVQELQQAMRMLGLDELADKFKTKHPSDEWVDLGLSSGTRWKNTAEKGYYTYGQAMAKFGGKLPVNQQWKELMTECQWEWTGNGFKVTGSNGNSIYLPEAGFRQDDSNVLNIGGYYWSSTLDSEGFAWNLCFYSSGFVMNRSFRCYGQSVILVDNQN